MSIANQYKPATKSRVYFVQNTRTGNVKIGLTSDVCKRLSGLQTSSDGQLATMRVIDGGRATEKWLHRKFKDARVRGEWFEFRSEMMTVVPPDEIFTPPTIVVRRDIRLTLQERLVQSERNASDLGLLSKSALTLFVTTLREDEAQEIIKLIRAQPHPSEAVQQ